MLLKGAILHAVQAKMAAQQQVTAASAAKRHKVSVSRPAVAVLDPSDAFPGISRIEYRPEAGPEDTIVYRFYNATERIHGRTMEDWIRPAISLSTLRFNGLDDSTYVRTPGQSSPDKSAYRGDGYKKRIRAAFELCTKLGLKLWSAWDSDLTSDSPTLSPEDVERNFEESVELVAELQTRTGVRPLCFAADLHSSSRYQQGAVTAPEATVVTVAGAALNRSLAAAQRLGSECFLFWGGREEYNSALNTDATRDIRMYGRLLRMIVDKRDRIGFRGQLLFEAPKRFYNNRYHNIDYTRNGQKCTSHRYDNDSCGALCLLKHHGLERNYRLCVSAPPIQDTFIISGYGALGAVRTDTSIPPDPRETTLLMKTILEQGGLQPGGIILQPRLRKDSTSVRDLVAAHVALLDSLARALRIAGKIIADGIFSRNLQNRYLSFHTGFGSRLASGDATLEDCDEQVRHIYQQQSQSGAEWGTPAPSRSDHWELVCGRYIEQDRAGR